MKRYAVRNALLGLAAAALLPSALLAQCENRKGFSKALCEMNANNANTPQISGLGKPKNTAISTSFSDTIKGEPLPPSVEPKAFSPLSSLERNDDGAFILKPGFYEASVQSFALDSGDANVTKQAGYYPAPIKGHFAKILSALLKDAELHPDITQAELQQLVFVIAAGTDLEQMPPAIQQIALRALPKESLKQLQGAAQANAFNKALMDAINARIARDPNAQRTLGQLSQMGAQAQQNADAQINALPEPVARGAWAQMPGGFYVRYLPEGYAKTRIQIIVPEAASSGSPLTFDPTQYLAILGQVPSERLGITLRPAR